MERKTATATQMEGTPRAIITASEIVANYEENQYLQTRVEALKENWKGVLWCLYSFICCMFGMILWPDPQSFLSQHSEKRLAVHIKEIRAS
ncbi:hypothetical protein BKA61DRAFT_677531 [Leptodontidium sp. MPI-SDFR-AT-0119]|nr:hypothetical protein BKA61DRAFT_677531 [Leptodontidium sp. MPI-SDFR-AT-0119]